MENSIPRLRTVFRTYPHTQLLKSGELTDPRVQLDFVEIEPIHRVFAPMARTQAYDVSEMAIVTYLQAKAYNKPLVMLPTVVAARFQQGCIIYNSRRGAMSVGDLPGARVGVRAYTQTTGVWVRGILAQTYGVPLEKIDWVTFEGSHLEEYRDPSFVRRAPAGKDMLQMLRDGELDAAILGSDLPDEEGLAPLIPDAKEADRQWYAQHRFVPVNHLVVMRRDVAERYPQSAAAVFELLRRGKASVGTAPNQPDRLPFGVAALRRPLETVLAFCENQQLLPRKLTADEILDECVALLGDAAR